MIKWHPRFVTGHSVIDQEHERFFRHLETLALAARQEAGHAKVIESIAVLQDFALSHYEDDEAYMAQLGCRSHPENYEEHREFALRLEGWRFLLSAAGTPASLVAEVEREALSWIESHIEDNCCKLRACRCFELSVAG